MDSGRVCYLGGLLLTPWPMMLVRSSRRRHVIEALGSSDHRSGCQHLSYGQYSWLTKTTWIPCKDFSRDLNTIPTQNPMSTLDMTLLSTTLIVAHFWWNQRTWIPRRSAMTAMIQTPKRTNTLSLLSMAPLSLPLTVAHMDWP